MILEEETLIEYGYLPMDLKPHSNKPILAACDECGKIRTTSNHNYCSLCHSCAHDGKKLTEEAKAKMSAAKIGIKRAPFTEKHKRNISAAQTGKRRPNSCISIDSKIKDKKNYLRLYHKEYIKTTNGKNNILKNKTKRRELGYILIYPIKEGEVGHHVTNEYVIGVPKEVHQQFAGYKRNKHRALVLEWLKANDKKKYKLVLSVLAKE